MKGREFGVLSGGLQGRDVCNSSSSSIAHYSPFFPSLPFIRPPTNLLHDVDLAGHAPAAGGMHGKRRVGRACTAGWRGCAVEGRLFMDWTVEIAERLIRAAMKKLQQKRTPQVIS